MKSWITRDRTGHEELSHGEIAPAVGVFYKDVSLDGVGKAAGTAQRRSESDENESINAAVRANRPR